jgi:hypothetical protein
MTGRRPDARRFRRHLPAVALTIALAADIAAVVTIAATIRAGGEAPFDVFSVGGLVVGATYGIVGWIIASRRPDNAIGWVFLAIGLSQAIDVFAGVYSNYGLAVAPGSMPFAAELSWVVLWAWAPGFILLVTLSVLLFPDGRPPSPRWRPVLWASFAVMALLSIPFAILAWPYRGDALLLTGVPPADGAVGVAFGVQFIGVLASPFVAFASIAGMVVRFRRSGPTERQQLKWFTFAAVPEIAFIVSSGFVTYPPLLGAVGVILIAPLLPIAAAIAILRYRLYEIDRIVSRTIAYAVVTGLLIVAYGGLILLLQGPLDQVIGGDTVSVALSTLAVFAVSQPVLRRVRRTVDRRFNRARYDADRTASAFADRLRDEMDLANLSRDLDTTIRDAIAPSSVGLWLRGDRRLREGDRQ